MRGQGNTHLLQRHPQMQVCMFWHRWRKSIPRHPQVFPKKRRQVGSNSRLHLLRINPGQQPDPDPEAGSIWNDIDRTPPLNERHGEHQERRFRKPIGVGTALLFERSTKVGQQDRSFCQRFNGIEPILGEGGVRVLASRVQREPKMTFVQGHHLARRGLANQRLLRQHTGIELFSHSSNAVRAHLFVVRQHQHQRSGGTRSNLRKSVDGNGIEPLHVTDTSSIQTARLLADHKRVTGPTMGFHGDAIKMARDNQAIARGIHFRTSPSNQICLLPRGIADPLPPNPGDRLQPRFNQIHRGQV